MSEINTATSRHEPAYGASKAETTRHYLRRGALYLMAVALPLLVVWMRMRLPVPLEEQRMLVLLVPAILVPAWIVWTRFCDSGRLSHGISLTGFEG